VILVLGRNPQPGVMVLVDLSFLSSTPKQLRQKVALPECDCAGGFFLLKRELPVHSLVHAQDG